MKKFFTLVILLSSTLLSQAQWVSDPHINTLAATGVECTDPIIGVDSAGVSYISYRLPNGGGYSMYMQKVSALGYLDWGTPVLVSDDDHSQSWTSVYTMAIDPAANAIVTWEDSRTGNFDVFAAKVGFDGYSTWGQGGLQLSFGLNTDINPQVLPLADSSIVFAWQTDDSTGIYLQRISHDGTRMWGPNGLLYRDQTGSALHFYGWPRLALCNDTSFYLLFKKANANFNASQQKLSINKFGMSGQTIWPADIDFQSAGSIPNILTMNPMSDGQEGCIVAWMDGRGSGFYLDGYVQHLDPNGTSLLTTNGVDVCSVPGSLALDNISAGFDDAGNIYAYYNTTTEIYIQKVDASGNLLFGNNGTLVTSTTNSYSQLFGQHTSRGNLITYSEDLFPNNTYSAAMIDDLGNYVWSSQTMPFANGTSGKSNMTVTSEKNGQVVAAWQDDRTAGNVDVYVQNINAEGSLGVGMKSLEPSALSIYPNPARNTLTVSMKGSMTARYLAEIRSLDGRLLRTEQLMGPLHTLDVSGLAAGSYLLRFAGEKNVSTQPFAVIR